MSAYQFDSIKSFDELRIALRRIERQHAKLPSKVTKTVGCRSAQDKEKKTEKEDKQEKSELAKLKASIQQLTAEMSDIKKAAIRVCLTEEARSSKEHHLHNGWMEHHGEEAEKEAEEKKVQPGPRGYQHDPAGPACFRCGEKGHIKIGCRVRLGHLRQQDL